AASPAGASANHSPTVASPVMDAS
ncbi:MAG: hypothetical protein JWM82_6, partial [Myxococcales bacterium]|nr:hypothetical protein [Myxococcales bacterium]